MPKKAKKVKKTENVAEIPVVASDPRLNLTAKLEFENELVELNRRLAKLKSDHAEQELEVVECTKGVNDKREDQEDIILYLKRTISELSDRITHFQDIKQEIERKSEDVSEKYEKILDEKATEFHTMEEILNLDNVTIENKLSTLEDLRQSREELMIKFDLQDQVLYEQSKRHKEEIYEMEKNVIISMDRIKKEIEYGINKFSEDLETTTDIRMAACTNKAVWENIEVNNNLIDVIENYHDIFTKNAKLKFKNKQLRQLVSLEQQEYKISLRRYKHQNIKMLKILKEYSIVTEQLKFIESRGIYNSELNKNITVINGKIKSLKLNNDGLLKFLQKIRDERSTYKNNCNVLRKENLAISNVFEKIERIIKVAMAIENIKPQAMVSILNDIRRTLNTIQINALPLANYKWVSEDEDVDIHHFENKEMQTDPEVLEETSESLITQCSLEKDSVLVEYDH